MMTHEEMIALIEAHRDGKVIQYRLTPKGPWRDRTLSGTDFNYVDIEYRIKPEPLTLQECLEFSDLHGACTGRIYQTRQGKRTRTTIENLKILCKYYKGREVAIYWDDTGCNWLTYKLLDYDFVRDEVIVQGILAPDGHKHDGSIFTAPIADIHSIKLISEYKQ